MMNHKIIKKQDGTIFTEGEVNLIIHPDGECKAFNRNKIGTDGSKKTWLVGELDGVRVYINGRNIIMSKQDLRP